MLPSSDSVGFGPALIDPNPKYPILEALCPIVRSTAFLVLESVEDSFPAAAAAAADDELWCSANSFSSSSRCCLCLLCIS